MLPERLQLSVKLRVLCVANGARKSRALQSGLTLTKLFPGLFQKWLESVDLTEHTVDLTGLHRLAANKTRKGKALHSSSDESSVLGIAAIVFSFSFRSDSLD